MTHADSASPRAALRAPRTAWSALVLALGTAAVAALVPATRPTAAVVGAVASVTFVLLGMLLHRPASRMWGGMAAMLALWTAAVVVVQVEGVVGGTATALVYAGQAIGVGGTLLVARMGADRTSPAPGSRVDAVIIVTVLGLACAQLVMAGAAGSGNLTALLVPTVDVAILGMLLRLAVTRALTASSHLALAGVLVTVVYDLTSAVQGRRLGLPGEPTQALGVACLLLIGVAALHPSMVVAFDPARFGRSRPASASLLGLLPLVVVPVGLWWVAAGTGMPGLPTGALLLGGAVVAGLCLVRAAYALRDVEHLADHDPLTELANRRGLERALAQEAPAAGRSMLLVDVDEFKQVNDTHGHDVGDALLLAIRDRLLEATTTPGPSAAGTGPGSTARRGADVVARLGGDEFVVLTAADRADATADRVLRALRVPIHVGALELRVSASIGIANAEPGASSAELLTRADVAMYAAKAAGRDTAVRFHPQMRTEVSRRFTLTNEVRQLLATQGADVGRLEVHYQPLVELRSGTVVGAEALVRWRHPEHGLLQPADFLGVVSSSGLDARLDRVVLLDVITQLRLWHDRGYRVLPVSVNLTGDSLADPRLAERVLSALSEGGVPTRLLHVEITEHQALPDDSPAARSLRRLHEAGVSTHLDDYGAGYTSLDYLRRFPVEVLKLDRSVITSMADGSTNLVAGVAAMAAAWDLKLLAEGVETAEQRTQLVDVGVRYGQGYLFSRPLPAQEYEAFLARPGDGAPSVLPAPRERTAAPVATAAGTGRATERRVS